MLSNATYDLMETAAVISRGSTATRSSSQADERQLEILVPHLREHLERESAAKAA